MTTARRRSTRSTSPTGWATARSSGPPTTGLRTGHHVRGRLTGAGRPDAALRPAGRRRGLPGAGGRRRRSGTRATRPGGTARSCCVECDGRLTLAVPGTGVHRRPRAGGARPAGQGGRRLDPDRVWSRSASASCGGDRRRLVSCAWPPREIALLTNPTAGKGRGARARDAALAPAARRRVRGPRPGGPRRRRGARPGPPARRRRGRVAGGASAATAWSTSASRRWPTPTPPLGIIPAGTGNDVARYFDLPRKDPVARPTG